MSMLPAGSSAEKLRTLRGLLAVIEERSTDPAVLAASLAMAREDGAMIAARVVTILSEGMIFDEVPPTVEDLAQSVLTGFIGERTDALRAGGTADNEALAYALGATIAAAETLERARALEGANAQGRTGPLH